MPVIQFTPAFMATGLVCPPDKKKIEYSVADTPGLFVECRASKTAVPTWYLRLKNENGTNCYRKLGTIDDLTLVQARKRAAQIKAEHLLMQKEADVIKQNPGQMTLDKFFHEHYMPHAKQHKRSFNRDESLYRVHIAPVFKDLPLQSISRREVQKFHNDLREKKGLSPASADHGVRLMCRFLNLALKWEFVEKNVLRSIELFKVDNQVENYLDEEQLGRLLHVLKTDHNRPICHILMFLLSTGARLNEALTATWANVNEETRTWKVDAKRSKSKKPRFIPLNDSAMWVLGELKRKSEYLFPSPVTGKPYTAITWQWYRIRALAGVNLRIHDLRHTFASFLVSNGRSLFEVQQILGHSDPKVTMRYAHLSSKALQEAANAGSMIV